MPAEDPLLEVETPLGFVVICSEARWAEILVKHPVMVVRLEDVKQTLTAPDEVRKSSRDG